MTHISIMKKIITSTLLTLVAMFTVAAATPKTYSVSSPDKQLSITVTVDNGLYYTVEHAGVQLVAPSKISMTLSDGIVYGDPSDKVKKTKSTTSNEVWDAIMYKKNKNRT